MRNCLLNLVELSRGKSSIPGERRGLEPELRLGGLTAHMHDILAMHD
jgi:hypothetical protein